MLLHGAATALVAVDVGVRSIRLHAYARESGGSLTPRDSVITTLAGDAAAALTPWRLGGEPMRVAAMKDGCTVSQSVVALGSESAVNYVVVALCGAWLGSRYGSAWWREVGSQMAPAISSNTAWWLIAFLVLLVVAGGVLLRKRRRMVARAAASLRRALAASLRASHKLLAIGLVLSAVSLVARVALLPLLAIGVSQSVEVGVLAFVSFGLLYGQLVMPTPSGAGAVDALVLGGATGVHQHAGAMLAAWRFYSTLLPTVAGIVVTLAHFGPGFIRLAFARPRDDAANGSSRNRDVRET
jgi:uncharacterized membrane protein YbhN (UPF0104 family)